MEATKPTPHQRSESFNILPVKMVLQHPLVNYNQLTIISPSVTHLPVVDRNTRHQTCGQCVLSKRRCVYIPTAEAGRRACDNARLKCSLVHEQKKSANKRSQDAVLDGTRETKRTFSSKTISKDRRSSGNVPQQRSTTPRTNPQSAVLETWVSSDGPSLSPHREQAHSAEPRVSHGYREPLDMTAPIPVHTHKHAALRHSPPPPFSEHQSWQSERQTTPDSGNTYTICPSTIRSHAVSRTGKHIESMVRGTTAPCIDISTDPSKDPSATRTPTPLDDDRVRRISALAMDFDRRLRMKQYASGDQMSSAGKTLPKSSYWGIVI